MRHIDTALDDRRLAATAAMLTLVTTLAYGGSEFQPVVSALCLFGIAIPEARRSIWLPAAIFFVLALALLYAKLQVDNHKYLAAYLLLALAIANAEADEAARLRALALSSRLMVAIVFLAASRWKLANGEFIEGGFFVHLLYVDGRSSDMLNLLPFFSIDRVIENQENLAYALESGQFGVAIPVATDPGMYAALKYLAWFALYEQVAIGVLFLAPMPVRYAPIRDAHLLFFIYTVYPVFPVTHFGILLSILGLLQTDASQVITRRLYLLALLALCLFSFHPYYQLADVPERLWSLGDPMAGFK